MREPDDTIGSPYVKGIGLIEDVDRLTVSVAAVSVPRLRIGNLILT